MKSWNKHINIVDARKLTESFCNYFSISPCEVYYVDVFHDKTYGVYLSPPPVILMLEKLLNPIGILMHELTHHLESEIYPIREYNGIHGYNYQLAKDKVIRWCNKYISSKPDWRLPLKAIQHDHEMKNFKL